MVFFARPRNGATASIFKYPYVEVTYSLLVTCLIGVGVAAALSGIVGMAGF